jgi:hypothetical protein
MLGGGRISTPLAHIVWKQVGREWYAVAGRWDLYLDNLRRSEHVLATRQLSDERLDVA